MKKAFLLTFLFALISAIGFSQVDQYWSANAQDRKAITADKAVARLSYPKEFTLYNLDIAPLRQELFKVVDNSTKHSTIISLPNADGKMEQFEVVEASNFDPLLQAQFPQIRAFSGTGITARGSMLKLTICPSLGISGMVFRLGGEMEFIEAYSADHSVYSVYRSQRERGKLPWTCSTEDKNMANAISSKIANPQNPEFSDGNLRTMRLAQSVTAEYSNFFGAFDASNLNLVLGGINATMGRCNGCYEKDLAIHLNLIPNESAIIYYNPNTDPYSPAATGAGGAWNGELQANLTATIGEANYDIGHLFGASGGGGNAGCIGCVCVNGSKGSGFTSPADNIPQGDNFDIDYVVHEVGHQLGGNHSFTFQNDNAVAQTEVGAGITIMGYAGITSYDPAPHSIDIYTGTNIAQIQTNILAKACPVVTSISANNATPVITSTPFVYIIPMQTPFALTGAATDANAGDVLTYCWEQNDQAGGQFAANSVARANKPVGPNFLTWPATTSPTRVFPRLSTILAGSQFTGPLPGGDAICNIEYLSNVARAETFRLTVRDNHVYSSTVPISVGQTATQLGSTLTIVATAGPFVITAPNTAVTWPQGSSQTVTWNVASTDVNLGANNVANVKISLSTDGGNTFPTVLLASTPNDGSQTITVPNTPTTTARIKVEAIGNIFFDIDDANFTISAPTTTSDLGITKTDGVTTYTPGGTTTYTIVATNAGPDGVTGATVADVFPAAITSVNWTAVYAGGATGPASGSGNINATVNIPSGGTCTFTAICNISGAATGSLSNTATVTVPAGVSDPNGGNNSATDTDNQANTADLSITKTDGTTTYTAGGTTTYTIVASNAGASAANPVTVADVFPAAITSVNWTAVYTGGATGPASGSGNINATTVNLPVGGTATFTAICNISGAATGNISNTATVSSALTDPNPANNSATDTDSPPLAACGNWVASTVIPVPILDNAVIGLGANLYSFAGVSNGAVVQSSYKFDGTTWTAIAAYPVAVEYPSAVTNGTDIYIMGGALTGTGAPQTSLYRYNVAANTYTPLASFTTATWNQTSVYLNGKIYKFGGTNAANGSANALEIYDITGNSWTAGAPLPLAGSFIGGFTDGTFIYAAGGLDATSTTPTTKTYRYTVGSNTWDDAGIADLPATRWGPAYGWFNSAGILAGGYVGGAATANISTSALQWNPGTNTWNPLNNMIGERARLNGGVIGASFYAVGGRSVASAAFNGTNDNQKLTCGGPAVIVAGTTSITAEGCTPPNGAIDPSEVVTVSFCVNNTGGSNTTNLVGTLQNTGGVTGASGPQTYGVVVAGGAAVCKSFSFTANGSCGNTITASIQLQDGATNLGTITYVLRLGALNTVTILSQNFDAVAVPALPAGWTATSNVVNAASNKWATTNTASSSAPNSAFTNDPTSVSDELLISPSFAVGAGGASLTFKNRYDLENTFDGMVLEISINGGGFTDIITAGGVFTAGGYNGTISTTFSSPIGGRQAWTGTSAGYPAFITTTVTLPPAASGQNVVLRWRRASDTSAGNTGSGIDDVVVSSSSYVCCNAGADLSITKTDGTGVYLAGGTTTYTIVATNNGPASVTGATVADVFPAAITAVNWTAVYTGGGSGPASGSGNINASVNLPAGATATFTAVCTISGAATGNLVNTATVSSAITDPTPANNSATDTDIPAPVTVTATAGTAGPTPYLNLKLAFDAINAGTHQGAIIVNINGNTDEGTTPAVINSTGTGASIYTSVLVRPTADNLSIVGGVTPTTRCVIELNGADNVTIDGDNPNTAGTNRNLTVTLTGSTASIGLIWIKSASATDGCSNNTIKNCILRGQDQSNTTIGILTGSGATFGGPGQAASNNNTIQNNAFSKSQNGIYLNGFATTPFDANWTIDNNDFGSTVAADKHIFRGMILQNVSNFTISNNRIQGVVSTVASSANMSGIQLAGSGLGGNIFGNKISDIKQTNPTGWGAEGITLGFTTTTSGVTVYNNFISDVAGQGFNGSSVSDNGNGIAIVSGGGYNLYYNTVIMNTNQVATTGLPAALLVNTVTTNNTLDIRNNIFANTQTVGTQRYVVNSVSTAARYLDINYNDYFTLGPNLGFLGSNRANLAAWQAATGKDANSVSVQPVTVSATDLHLVPTANCGLDGLGVVIAAVTTDIDGAVRSAGVAPNGPDMGADEFTAVTPSATIAYTGSPYCSLSGTATVTQTGTTGGTYTATPAGLSLNPSTGAVILGTSTPGSYTVTYTIAAAGSCPQFTTTAPISITQGPSATISYPGGPFCPNPGTVNVVQTGTPGGTYSATPAGLSIDPVTGAINTGTSAVGTYTVTYTIAPSGACPQYQVTTTVIIGDNTPPTINCPTTAIVVSNDNNQCGAIVNYPTPTATDNCLGAVTVTVSPASGSFFPVGITVVTVTATDISGNTATCTFQVKVVDTQLPVFTCPSNITVSNTAGQCGATVTWPAPVATDNCPGVTVTSSPASGSFFPIGTTTVTVTAKDASNNVKTCTFTVTVNDTQLPTVICPANIITTNTVGQCGAIVTYPGPQVSDNCPGYTVTTTPASGSFFPVGITTVTVTVTDASGNVATCTFTVRVNDVQLPTIICPANIIVGNTAGQCGANVSFTPTATDNCPGVVITSVPASGSFFPVGTTTVTSTATDASGNIKTCTFTVRVNDTQAPVVTCPANITVSNTAGQCGAVVTYTPTATDNCPGVTVTSSPASGSFFPVGTTTVTTTATDAAGNVTTCTFTVKVNDTQAPTIVCPANITVVNTANTCGAVVNYPAPTFTDNCPGGTITSSPASGTTFPVGTTTVTSTATDAAGNVSTCTFTVRVNDVQAPVIVCPANITVTPPVGTCTAVVNYTATVTDNCPGATITVTSGLPSGSTFPTGVTTVVLTATDASGNTATCSFTVTVNDPQLPVITTQPLNRTACVTDNITFTVVATNALSYQWQLSTNGGATWTNLTNVAPYSNVTTAAMSVNPVAFSMNGFQYRVLVNGLCRTVTSNAVTLSVSNPPTAILSAYPLTVLQPGDVTTLTVVTTPATGGTVVWKKDGVVVPFSGRVMPITVDGLGTWTVTYTDVFGCTVTSNALVIAPNPTTKMFVYPVPNDGHFHVRMNFGIAQYMTIRVVDGLGHVMYKYDFNNSAPFLDVQVDISKYSAGPYWVELLDEHGKKIDHRSIVVAH